MVHNNVFRKRQLDDKKHVLIKAVICKVSFPAVTKK